MIRAILLAALATALPATAAVAQEAPTARVSYADLDLSTVAGRHTLERRVGWAVRAVCGSADIRDLPAFQAEIACRRTALGAARTQIASVTARRAQQLALGPTASEDPSRGH